jgi:hypothetical protein
VTSTSRITPGLGVGEGEIDKLSQSRGVGRLERRIGEQKGEAIDVVVGEDARPFFGEEPGGDHHLEALPPVAGEDVTEAIEGFATDAATARFETAEGAVVDLGELGDLLLAETALVSEAEEERTEAFGISHSRLALPIPSWPSRITSSWPLGDTKAAPCGAAGV